MIIWVVSKGPPASHLACADTQAPRQGQLEWPGGSWELLGFLGFSWTQQAEGRIGDCQPFEPRERRTMNGWVSGRFQSLGPATTIHKRNPADAFFLFFSVFSPGVPTARQVASGPLCNVSRAEAGLAVGRSVAPCGQGFSLSLGVAVSATLIFQSLASTAHTSFLGQLRAVHTSQLAACRWILWDKVPL